MATLIRFRHHPFTEFDRLFDDAFAARSSLVPSVSVRRVGGTINAPQRPRMDVIELKDTNAVMATFELPGLTPEHISIELQQNRLTVSDKSGASHSREEGAVREGLHGKFSRTLRLPFGTKPEDVTAKLEHGLLTVTFPKSNPEQLPQRVAIQ